jgi:hypothetical protein
LLNLLRRRRVIGLISAGVIGGTLLAACDEAPSNNAATAALLAGDYTTVDVQAPPSADDSSVAAALRGDFNENVVDTLVGALGRAGITVVSDPRSPQPLAQVTGHSLIKLFRWQVRNMAREAHLGGGIPGADIDRSLPAPRGGVSYSYFLGAWVSHWMSPRARLAHVVMGTRDWTNAPALAWPSLVLTLFDADAADEAAKDTGTRDPMKGLPPPVAGPQPVADAGAAPQALLTAAEVSPGTIRQEIDIVGACQSVASFVSDVVDRVANVLKIDVSKIDTGNDVVNGVASFFATLWNVAVTTLTVFVNGALAVFDAGILGWLRAGVGVLGVIVQIVNLFKPLDLQVSGTPERTRFAQGDEPDQTGVVGAQLDATRNQVPYPPFVSGCASAIGVPLPEPGIKGAHFRWEVSDPDHVITTTSPLEGVASESYSTVRWITGRESTVNAGSGEPAIGNVDFTFILFNGPLQAALDALRNAVNRLIDGNTGPFAGPIHSVVDNALQQAQDTISRNIGLTRTWALTVSHSKAVTCTT